MLSAIFINWLKMFPDPREPRSEKKNLMIFYGLLLEKQKICESYYVRRRHSNVDSFYLAQNYFKLPGQTIRENANFICLSPQDLNNLKNHFFEDHVGSDMTKEDSENYARQLGKNNTCL